MPIAKVAIKCGIYWGNALPPLLCYIGLNTLSEITEKSGYTYRLWNGAVLSHILSDIKMYARREQVTDWLIHTTSMDAYPYMWEMCSPEA